MLARSPLRSNAQRQAVARSNTVSAPIEGWDAISPLESMGPMRAVELVNWFCQPGWIEVRKGSKVHTKVGTSDVESLLVWRGPSGASKMFAATGSKIYDVSAASGAMEVVSGLASARFQSVVFVNSGNSYLYACNGQDACRHYNGSTWSTPTLTGVVSQDVIQINAHKRRLWLITKESTKAWYLATDAIAGAATSFELGSLFSRGGYLMAMATWTRDGGSGPDDVAVFISSEGQCALYSGTDPAGSSTWSIIGTFDLPRPVGRRCVQRLGADLLLLTAQGVFPLSKLLGIDKAEAAQIALSSNISPAITTAVDLYGNNFGWEIAIHYRGTKLIVNVPRIENGIADQYVMNTITGAWSKFVGWPAQCFGVYNNELYFGTKGGYVYKADTGVSDTDSSIVATGQTAYTALGSAALKHITMVKPLITATGSNRPRVGVSTDFQETQNLSTVTSSTGVTAGKWGSMRWGRDVWGGGATEVNDWGGAAALGTFASVKFQAETGATAASAFTWGFAYWGAISWGGVNGNETVKINGFLMLSSQGGYI